MSTPSTIKIMIVDWNQEHVNILIEQLINRNHTVIGFSNPVSAFASFYKFKPDLLICEAQFPSETRGWDLAFEILKEDPKIRPYMVALTSRPTRLNKCLCAEFGFDEYVEKPTDMNVLLGWVTKAKKLLLYNGSI